MLTLTKLLGVAVLGAWLVHALVHRRAIHVPLAALPLAAFLVWAAASALWAVDPDTTTRLTLTLVQLLALYLLVTDVLGTPAALRRALAAHLAGAVLLAVLGLVLMSEGILQQGRAAIVVDQQMFVESNELAAALLFPLAVSLAWGLDRSRPSLERLVVVVAGALCLTTLVLTLSRGALVAAAVMIVAVAVAQRSVALPFVVTLLAVPAIAAAGPELWERLSEGATLADRAAGRLDIWQVGLVVIRSHPFAGVGFGCFPIVYFDYLSQAAGVSWKHAMAVALTMEKSPHSTYLGATAELGVVGLALLVVALALHLRTGLRLYRGLQARRHPAASLVLACLTALLGLVVFAFSTDIVNRKYLWLALGLAVLGRMPVGGQRATRGPAGVTASGS